MRGENQSRGERWQSSGRGRARERTCDRGRGHYRRGRECCRGRGGARERTCDRGRGHYRGRGRECCRGLGRGHVIGGGDIIEGGEGNVVGGRG